ncbi:leucine dehydrogenase [Hyphomonas neptunium ATCC 15444]|uniref:Leucine dehydrogenase n=2 Tax=Hyphomonas TaxID=85 RepID=Q0C1S0_HYPNA|nr:MULTISPECIES: amino acid dehydrogenase [Hyphomonas]ABI77394.1 leucine dehydrogenase [Hyphomonas neptunium ATCC 15444]KCZ92592.1 leucine dehydrogenase [Hyphomonas hirschiana VP5]
MFEHESYDGHEQVVHVQDAASGLKAIIALHSTALGPAGGGCRLWHYEDPGKALTDALRLSRGMSYKNALAGLQMGGGKAVILGPVPDDRRQAVFEAFGDAVNRLGGRYVTAEDVGVGVSDMKMVGARTKFVSGLSEEGGVGGDPSPYTARGVRLAMEAVALHVLGARSLEGVRVAVQGLGGVGANLCRELSERGAKLIVADINQQRVERICDEFRAERAEAETILFSEVDILAPCALGGVMTEASVPKVRARAVVGGANNQLLNAAAGQMLFDRQITYAPDYLVNAGGIIMVAAEYFGTHSQAGVLADVERIFDRTCQVLLSSRKTGAPPHLIADHMAAKVIETARQAEPGRPAVSRAENFV